MDNGMKKGDQWFAEAPVPHAVPTCSLTEVMAMQEMLSGEWKPVRPTDDCWWEDNDTLPEEDFWYMVNWLRYGNWR